MSDRPAQPAVVLPSRDDPFVTVASGAVGGPAGVRVAAESGVWTALRIVLVMALMSFGFGLVLKEPCRSDAWSQGDQYVHACYSDIAFLYRDRGLADGKTPYGSTNPAEQVEYPVLTGGVMFIAAKLTGTHGPIEDRMRRFYDITAIALLLAALGAVYATARTHRRRPWDAAMVALAPGLLLAATINWDLIAVALTAGALLAWSRSRPMLTGVMLGLAVAAKFYPLFVLGPLLVLCIRAGRMRDFWRTAVTGFAVWAAVNLPVYLAWPEGWKKFYVFSTDRSWDYGSLWYALDLRHHPVPRAQLNAIALGSFLVLCGAIAVLALSTRRRPRVPQLVFLVVAAFLVTNKVYSPQFVLWLIPLAVLARPRWRDFLIWQLCEVVYFFAAWWFLQSLAHPDRALPADWYAIAVFVHILGTLYFAAMVVRDIVLPECDPVRSDGVDIDDPAGGVLDHAPDRFVLRVQSSTRSSTDATGATGTAGVDGSSADEAAVGVPS